MLIVVWVGNEWAVVELGQQWVSYWGEVLMIDIPEGVVGWVWVGSKGRHLTVFGGYSASKIVELVIALFGYEML